MSHIDRFTRLIKFRLILSCSLYFFLFGIPTAVAMQLDSPFKFDGNKSDISSKQEADEAENAGEAELDELQSELNLTPDAHLLRLQQEIKNLSSITKELRNAQDRIDARIFAIESRLNSQAASPAASDNRLWRSIQGKTIIATLTKATPDHVVLTRNGKQATIPLNQLSTADQEYVAKQAKKMAEEGDSQRADIRELGVIR